MDFAPGICQAGAFRIRISGATDLGLRRSQNEDSYGCWLPADPDECRRRGLLLAIADGMGGARGGEVASRIAIETVMSAYRESPGGSLPDELEAALRAAN